MLVAVGKAYVQLHLGLFGGSGLLIAAWTQNETRMAETGSPGYRSDCRRAGRVGGIKTYQIQMVRTNCEGPSGSQRRIPRFLRRNTWYIEASRSGKYAKNRIAEEPMEWFEPKEEAFHAPTISS